MRINKVAHIVRRAFGGFRRRPWFHLLSVITLGAAFLSFAATLTAAVNMDTLLSRWVDAAELTVYLRSDAADGDLIKLAAAVREIDGVEGVEAVTPENARDRFSRDLGSYGEMGASLPLTAFPGSLDIRLKPALSRNTQARTDLAVRLENVAIVEEVQVYDEWFERLSAVSLIGRLAVWGLGLLTMIVAVLVVAATIRAGVNSRRKEIEVLRFVGATDRYVRLPFLLEGALEAVAAMCLALVALHFMMNRIDLVVGQILPLIGGGSMVRLGSMVLLGLILGGLAAGFAGARLSLRRLDEAR